MMHSHREKKQDSPEEEGVLILVVMDDALALKMKILKTNSTDVLILVVMDDALARTAVIIMTKMVCLNPCCNG